jgi:hypothetical protein
MHYKYNECLEVVIPFCIIVVKDVQIDHSDRANPLSCDDELDLFRDFRRNAI